MIQPKLLHFLIISDIVDVTTKKITHYSLDKGLNLGKGIVASTGSKVDYIVSTDTYTSDNITYIDYKTMSAEQIDLYDYVIIVREGMMEYLFDTFVELKKVFFNLKRKTKIIIKSDSCGWVIDKDFRKYIGKEAHINESTNSVIRYINSNINVICVQNEDFFSKGLEMKFSSSRMMISNMAVPYITIDWDNIPNPYFNDYSYCKIKTKLGAGDSLIPSYYVLNPNDIGELYKPREKPRIKIIYMGRIKTDGGKIIYLLKDIIEQLGDEYELHIFPGSFVLANEETKRVEKFSANNSNHLEIMRDRIFSGTKNVFVHCPFDHKDLYKYLWHVDIGIDFSSSRPHDIKASAGNAKLLEYCYVGLPVVTEKNVNNSWLVTNCKNGILLDGIGTCSQYVESIQKLLFDETYKVDRKKASMITMENENWNLRGAQFVENLIKLFGNNC